jgi:hypothetical protein
MVPITPIPACRQGRICRNCYRKLRAVRQREAPNEVPGVDIETRTLEEYPLARSATTTVHGGIRHSAYPRFQALQAEETARVYDQALVGTIVPLVPGLPERLRAGINVLDVGAGQGMRLSCRRGPIRRR